MRVQLADIAKSYGAQVVLDDVSLTIGPRARIGLVGPNGVGKSTLLRLVVGTEVPDRGTIARAPMRSRSDTWSRSAEMWRASP